MWAAATHQRIIYFKLTLADVKWCQCDHRRVLSIKPKLGSLNNQHTNLWRSGQWSIRAILLSWIIFHRFDELKCNQLSGRANVTRFVDMNDSFISLLISFPLLWAAGILMNSSQLPFFCPVIHLLNHFTCGVSVERCALSLGDQTLFFSLCWGNAFYLLFMLLMPHPDTDIISLPFFMWFCHHLTNIHGLESGSLFFF